MFSRGTIRERNVGDLAGVDEWLFIAGENILVIRLLSTEKCDPRKFREVLLDVDATFYAMLQPYLILSH
jgi:hypothetical protein